jgi:teichuronic acid biosynthesis glycosyltransferase TuaG
LSDSVSVVIPTWNRAGRLVEAIASALAQSAPVLEVLVCDDGSTDDSAERVAALAAVDPRVRWLPGARGGRPAIPRNRGIAASRGEWLAFLDSDDTWLPGKLAAQLEAARRLGCGTVCSNALRVVDGSDAGPLLAWRRPVLLFRDLLRENLVVCSSCVARRSLVQRAGGFPEAPQFKAIEDYALWLRLSTLGDFAYCADPLVRYRDEPKASIRAEQQIAPLRQKLLVLEHLQDWLTSDFWRGLGHASHLLRTLVLRSKLTREAARAANA